MMVSPVSLYAINKTHPILNIYIWQWKAANHHIWEGQPENIWYLYLINDCDYFASKMVAENCLSFSADVEKLPKFIDFFCRSKQKIWVCSSTLGLTKATLCEMNCTDVQIWAIFQASFCATPSVSGHWKPPQHPEDIALHLFDLQKGVKVF